MWFTPQSSRKEIKGVHRSLYVDPLVPKTKWDTGDFDCDEAFCGRCW